MKDKKKMQFFFLMVTLCIINIPNDLVCEKCTFWVPAVSVYTTEMFPERNSAICIKTSIVCCWIYEPLLVEVLPRKVLFMC